MQNSETLKKVLAQVGQGQVPTSASSAAGAVTTASAAVATSRQEEDGGSERKTAQEAPRLSKESLILHRILNRCKKANQLDAIVEEILSHESRLEMLKLLENWAEARHLFPLAMACASYRAIDRNAPGVSLKNFKPFRDGLSLMVFGSIDVTVLNQSRAVKVAKPWVQLLDNILVQCTAREQLDATVDEILKHIWAEAMMDAMMEKPGCVNDTNFYHACLNIGNVLRDNKTMKDVKPEHIGNLKRGISQMRFGAVTSAPSAMPTTGSSSSGVYFSAASSSSSSTAGSNNTQSRSSMAVADVNTVLYNDTGTDSDAKPVKPVKPQKQM